MANIVDPTTADITHVLSNKALAAQPVPLIGGSYSAGWETTSLAFNSNTVVADFRNPNANLILVGYVEAHITQMATSAVSATGLRNSLQLFIGRGYTVQSTTGATALTLSGNNCKLRTSYATPAAQIGFANVVGGITAGTVTEDNTALATSSRSAQRNEITAAAAPGAANQDPSMYPLIWKPAPMVGGPIVLAQNEGIRIRYLVTTAAAVIISGQFGWSELGTAVYP